MNYHNSEILITKIILCKQGLYTLETFFKENSSCDLASRFIKKISIRPKQD